MKKALQQQLDMLLPLVGNNKEHPQYKKLEAALMEADKVKKTEWDNPELHEKMKQAADKTTDND